MTRSLVIKLLNHGEFYGAAFRLVLWPDSSFRQVIGKCECGYFCHTNANVGIRDTRKSIGILVIKTYIGNYIRNEAEWIFQVSTLYPTQCSYFLPDCPSLAEGNAFECMYVCGQVVRFIVTSRSWNGMMDFLECKMLLDSSWYPISVIEYIFNWLR